MNKTQEKVVLALENSPPPKKCTGQLRDGTRRCIYGLAFDVLRPRYLDWNGVENRLLNRKTGQTGDLYGFVDGKLGQAFKDADMVQKNDSGWTFRKMAKFLRNLWTKGGK